MKVIDSLQFKSKCVVVEPDDTLEGIKEACAKLDAIRKSKPKEGSVLPEDLFCIQVPSQGVPQLLTESELRESVPIQMRQRGSIVFGGGMDRERWLFIAREEGYTVRDKGAFAELWTHATKKELADRR